MSRYDQGLFSRIRRWGERRRRKQQLKSRLLKEQDINTQTKQLLDVINQHGGPEGDFMRNMFRNGWSQIEIINSVDVLRKYVLPEQNPLQEGIDILHYAIENGSLKQNGFGTASSVEQLESVVESLTRARDRRIPLFVYTDIWGGWQGNKDSRLNSKKFAQDLLDSIGGFEKGLIQSKSALDLFYRKIERMKKSNRISYGFATRDIYKSLLEANRDTHPGSYELCYFFHEKDVLEEFPKMYQPLLKLNNNTPKRIFEFLHSAISHINYDDYGIKSKEYVEATYMLANRISFLLNCGVGPSLEDRAKTSSTPPGFMVGCDVPNSEILLSAEDIAGILPPYFRKDEAAVFVSGYSNLFDEIIRNKRKESNLELTIEDVKNVIPYLQGARFDVDHYVLDCVTWLKNIDFQESLHFQKIIESLKDESSPYSSLDIMVFSHLHTKRVGGAPLSPAEERMCKSMVTYAIKSNTKRRDDRSHIVEIVSGQENFKEIPEHVRDYFFENFDIAIDPKKRMMDIGGDNNAWYRWSQSADNYQQANTGQEGTLRDDLSFVGKIVNYLMLSKKVISNQNLSIIGLACGDAVPEINLRDIIRSSGYANHLHNTEFFVRLGLYDINESMIQKAAWNCYLKKINPSIRKKDIMKLRYGDLGDVNGRQLIISLPGKTYFNLENRSEELIDRIGNICYEHRKRGNTDPSVILLEGRNYIDMDYYKDKGAEDMHVSYFLRRLDAQRSVICYDSRMATGSKLPLTDTGSMRSSTYAPIMTPNEDRVEFYFLTLDSTPICGGARMLDKHQVVRCGESRVLSQPLFDMFEDKGLIRENIENDHNRNVVVVALIPDYSSLSRVPTSGGKVIR